jgi:hypothetical protein
MSTRLNSKIQHRHGCHTIAPAVTNMLIIQTWYQESIDYLSGLRREDALCIRARNAHHRWSHSWFTHRIHVSLHASSDSVPWKSVKAISWKLSIENSSNCRESAWPMLGCTYLVLLRVYIFLSRITGTSSFPRNSYCRLLDALHVVESDWGRALSRFPT